MIKMTERVKIRLNDGKVIEVRKQDLPAIKEQHKRLGQQRTLIGRIKWALGIK